MILVIDNYDSFTYNLVQYIGLINPDIMIVRNDKYHVNDIQKWKPSHIVISPGPGRPEEAGNCVDTIKAYENDIPILGVCLGHQAIILAYGGKVINSSEIVHGKTSKVIHNGSKLFHGLEETFIATRYHSLIADRKSFPKELKITSELENGIIMSIEHRSKRVQGVQFHPESIATEFGTKIIQNFLSF